jgi:hypothetical protein
MIYLEETFNLTPATPETLDLFVDFAQTKLVPARQNLGSRLIAAWYSDVEVFCQVTQILEFDSLSAYEGFRLETDQNTKWKAIEDRLHELAPQQRLRLLEPLGPVPPETLHEAISESKQAPLRAYSLAILEVTPGKMSDFKAGLEQMAPVLPIVASWRPITGKQNVVIDVWKGALRQEGYQPAKEDSKEFFRQLREVAPQEHLIPVYTLPYSMLK